MAVDERGKMSCPTRFVVGATENSKEGGVAAEVCSSQTVLWTKSNGNISLLLPGSPKWSLCRRGDLWTLSNQHHPPPTNIQCETMRGSSKPSQSRWLGIGWWVWVAGPKCPGVNNKYVHKNTRYSTTTPHEQKIKNTHQQLHQVQTNKNHQPYHEMPKNDRNGRGGYIVLRSID